jgi:hypothetical protein
MASRLENDFYHGLLSLRVSCEAVLQTSEQLAVLVSEPA